MNQREAAFKILDELAVNTTSVELLEEVIAAAQNSERHGGAGDDSIDPELWTLLRGLCQSYQNVIRIRAEIEEGRKPRW